MRAGTNCCWIGLLLVTVWGAAQPTAAAGDVLAYLGGAGNQQLRAVLELSDGTVLVGGHSDSLTWLPRNVAPTELADATIRGGRSGRRAFVLHLSHDLQKILHAVLLPDGAAVDVRRIRTTNRRHEPTGTLLISGMRQGDPSQKLKGGYFLARLDGNFVDRPPTRCEWVLNVSAESSIAEDQPWDVGADGKVVYGEGGPHGYDWVAIKRLTADGRPDVVEDWRLHWYQSGDERREWFGSPASACPLGKVVESGIVLKVWGRGDFRSWTADDYTAKTSDGNGGVKQGRWPFDAFFEGPFNPSDPKNSPRGRGYTGYGWPSTPCGNVGAIAIDRRDNHIYIGGNNKSTLPKGPDFEPYVIAMTNTGRQKWWMRLYREVPPADGKSKLDDQDARLSTPDQYVDGLAIDDSSASGPGALVVLARCHGNNVINFWKGNEVRHAANPGTSFQPHFTGSNGNIHYGWLGRLTLDNGELLHATFIGEYADGAKVGKKTWDDPNLDGWPRFDSAWPDINTTRCRPQVAVDAAGNIAICGTGRRPITTKNALQKMPKPGEGDSRWCDFVRIYNRELTTLRYSSVVAGEWDGKSKSSGSGVALQAAWPLRDAVLIVGHSTVDAKTGELGASPLPLQNPPTWSTSQRAGEDGVLGRLEIR